MRTTCVPPPPLASSGMAFLWNSAAAAGARGTPSGRGGARARGRAPLIRWGVAIDSLQTVRTNGVIAEVPHSHIIDCHGAKRMVAAANVRTSNTLRHYESLF